jgi:hypothetical protein
MNHADTVREALEASSHIGECAEHPEHLMDAENKAREALAAFARLQARQQTLGAQLAHLRALYPEWRKWEKWDSTRNWGGHVMGCQFDTERGWRCAPACEAKAALDQDTKPA